MSNLPNIKVSFFFAGDEFDLTEVTNQMQLTPTETREKESFPVQEFAQTTWELSTKRERCHVVSLQFEKLIQVLAGKEKEINQICSSYGLSVSFVVTIWMNKDDNPEIVLEKEIVSFAASINAEIGFDLYAY